MEMWQHRVSSQNMAAFESQSDMRTVAKIADMHEEPSKKNKVRLPEEPLGSILMYDISLAEAVSME